MGARYDNETLDSEGDVQNMDVLLPVLRRINCVV
jgi:hypothetical protein